MIKILVVEDDSDINNLLANILIDEGYDVTQAFSGTEAKFCIKEKDFQLILMDLMLPGLSGEELIKEIRKNNNSSIIVISAKDDIDSKVNVLKIGADDYIIKPFDGREVLVRIEVALRRSLNSENVESNKVILYKDIELEKSTRKVFVKNIEVYLTAKEFDILYLLLHNPKKIFSKNNIFESVWKEEFLGDDNTVNVHVSNLRNKLNKINKEENYIKTIWGIGFKMAD
ncbi:response regulator transcription factor [Eubacterium multiforme]|uniref:Stage 0 sporulation protein A homolog n=1 Tax=Eubacterium multiforme TaxID=83339 RepID=A0ABT9UUG5_9FIRM|nr:response regulator transcription factor [Eubacterium multiforme]MDQ0149963.1 DNA-binding response OmpR family regulator [Eubacterium multiforme]